MSDRTLPLSLLPCVLTSRAHLEKCMPVTTVLTRWSPPSPCLLTVGVGHSGCAERYSVHLSPDEGLIYGLIFRLQLGYVKFLQHSTSQTKNIFQEILMYKLFFKTIFVLSKWSPFNFSKKKENVQVFPHLGVSLKLH